MKKKPILAVTLVIAILLTMLCGCGNSPAAAESAQQEESVSTQTAQAQTSQSAESPSSSPSESAPAAEPEPEIPVEETAAEIAYPLSDEPVTFELWYSFPGDLADTMEEWLPKNSVLKAVEEVTNVNLTFMLQSVTTATENFNLLVVSGDYPDLFYDAGSYYSGGMDKAIEDNVILDLTDLIQENAPHYYSLISEDPELLAATTTASGRFAEIHRLLAEPAASSTGLVIRQDWLDALGLETPSTLDEFHDVLLAFKNEMGATEAYGLAAGGVQDGNQFTSAFDVSGQYADFMGTYPIYQVDGEVKCGWIEDGFRDYLALMHQWYEEGLIGRDFYIENNGHGIESSKTTTDQVGLWCHDYFQIELLQSMMADPNAKIVAVADAVAYEGQTLHFGASSSTLGGITWAITTDCWDPELCLRYIDYFFTEEGSLLCNYGVEGEGRTYDADGNPMYTELIYNNPDGLSMRQTQVMYTLTIGPFVEVESRGDIAYNEVAIEARQIWDSNTDDLYTMPNGVALNTEQAQEFANLIGDITTYVSGKIIEFIIGSDSLDNWDSYVASMHSFGIDRVIELYQEAYDSFVG